MDFNYFKKHFKKSDLIVVIISIILAIIGIVILNTLHIDTRHYKLPLSILVILNFLLLSLVIWIMHRLKSFVSLTYLMVTYKEIDNYENKITKIKLNPFIHLIIAIFFIVIFWIELTVTMGAYNNNWIEAAKHNWWIVLILFFINISIFEATLIYNLHSLNHDQLIKKELNK